MRPAKYTVKHSCILEEKLLLTQPINLTGYRVYRYDGISLANISRDHASLVRTNTAQRDNIGDRRGQHRYQVRYIRVLLTV